VRFILKRKLLLVLFVIGFAAIASAQGTGRRGGQSWRAPEKVTITGTMVFANGMPALKSGDDTYFVAGINRLIGFVDGFKEGAQVTVEGSVSAISPNASFKIILPSKLTFNGKSYDFAFPTPDFGYRRVMPRANNFDHGRRMQIPPRGQRHPMPFWRNP
jgi:hypothetical protein